MVTNRYRKMMRGTSAWVRRLYSFAHREVNRLRGLIKLTFIWVRGKYWLSYVTNKDKRMMLILMHDMNVTVWNLSKYKWLPKRKPLNAPGSGIMSA